MKIVVLSDSHGNTQAVEKVLQRFEDADFIIHLGDGEREVGYVLNMMPQIAGKFYFLKGNCDYGGVVDSMRKTLILPLPYDNMLFAAHGDQFQVKYGADRIVHEAIENEANIVLYGHTHERDCRYVNGVYVINPGSVACPRDGQRPSCAVISVTANGILASLVDL